MYEKVLTKLVVKVIKDRKKKEKKKEGLAVSVWGKKEEKKVPEAAECREDNPRLVWAKCHGAVCKCEQTAATLEQSVPH